MCRRRKQALVPAPPTMPRPPPPKDRPRDARSPSGRPTRVQRALPAPWAGPGRASGTWRGRGRRGSGRGGMWPVPGHAPPCRAGKAVQKTPPCERNHKGRRGRAGEGGARVIAEPSSATRAHLPGYRGKPFGGRAATCSQMSPTASLHPRSRRRRPPVLGRGEGRGQSGRWRALHPARQPAPPRAPGGGRKGGPTVSRWTPTPHFH